MWIKIQWYCFTWKFVAILVLILINLNSSSSGVNLRHLENGQSLGKYQENDHSRRPRAENMTLPSTTPIPIPNLAIGSLGLLKALGQSRQMMYTPAQIAEAMMLCNMGPQLVAAMMASQAQVMMLCQIAMMGMGGGAMAAAPAAGGAAPAAAAAATPPAGGAAPAAAEGASSGSGLGLKDLFWLGAGATQSVISIGILGLLAAMLGMSEVRRSEVANRFTQDEETLQNIYSLTRRCQYSGVGCFDTDPVLATI